MHRYAIVTLAALAAPVACWGQAFQDREAGRLADQIGTAMNVASPDIQELQLPAQPGGAFTVSVTIAGQQHELALARHSIRGENFRAAVARDGLIFDIPAPPVQTYRGVVVGLEGATVAAGFVSGRFNAMIRLPDHEQVWFIEPFDEHVPGDDRYIVYEAADVLAHPFGCAADDIVQPEAHTDHGGSGFTSRGDSRFELEIALDADWEYYHNRFFDDLEATLADMELIFNYTDEVYENHIDMSIVVTTMIVQQQENDPYADCNPNAGNPAGAMLADFRSHWNATMGGVHRDVACLFTGRFMAACDGNAIGIAYTPGMCNSNAYNVCESKYGGSNLAGRIALHAHELGHNLNAPHCSGLSCYIMCPSVNQCGGLGGFPPIFGNSSINVITNYAENQGCIDQGPPPPLFEEPWESTVIDSSRWNTNTNAVVNTNGVSEPSAPYSLNLDNNDVIESQSIDASELFGADSYLSLWTQARGPAAGRELTVEFFNAFFSWETLGTITAPGGDENLFTFQEYKLPFLGPHQAWQVRVTADGVSGAEDWYVDDFKLSPYCRADFNEDGLLNTSDFLDFLNAYNALEPDADWNRDGLTNTADFLAFLNSYNLGCPS